MSCVDGKYVMEQSYILEEDKDDIHYNAETEIRLRAFPHIRMELQDVFEGLETE
ncbi:MAG: hypothetical protein NC312_02345 [Bacteroides fragilis]|nr:hypothetical protein [Bacteroides fragilis]